jgi:hypothetical protein
MSEKRRPDSKSGGSKQSPLIRVAILGALAALISLIIKWLKKFLSPGDGAHEVFDSNGYIINADLDKSPIREPVNIINRGTPDLSQLDGGEKDEFKPEIPLVTLDVVSARDPSNSIMEFGDKSPLTLQFKFTQAQLEAARKDPDTFRRFSLGQLDSPVPVFGYWEVDHWVVFKVRKHQLDYKLYDGNGGVAIVKLPRWIDPPVAAWPP